MRNVLIDCLAIIKIPLRHQRVNVIEEPCGLRAQNLFHFSRSPEIKDTFLTFAIRVFS